MIAVEIKGKRGKPSTFVTEDDEFRKANFDKFPKLATVFQRESGTITAGIISSKVDNCVPVKNVTVTETSKTWVSKIFFGPSSV